MTEKVYARDADFKDEITKKVASLSDIFGKEEGNLIVIGRIDNKIYQVVRGDTDAFEETFKALHPDVRLLLFQTLAATMIGGK